MKESSQLSSRVIYEQYTSKRHHSTVHASYTNNIRQSVITTQFKHHNIYEQYMSKRHHNTVHAPYTTLYAKASSQHRSRVIYEQYIRQSVITTRLTCHIRTIFVKASSQHSSRVIYEQYTSSKRHHNTVSASYTNNIRQSVITAQLTHHIRTIYVKASSQHSSRVIYDTIRQSVITTQFTRHIRTIYIKASSQHSSRVIYEQYMSRRFIHKTPQPILYLEGGSSQHDI